VPHQVTRSITDRLMRIVGFPLDKDMYTITKPVNRAAASIPIALTEAIEEDRVKSRSKVLLTGSASGFSLYVISVVL